MFKISLDASKNFFKTSAKFRKLKEQIPVEILRVSNAFGNLIVRTSKLEYLTGPRPEKLGVVTGFLRSSIRFKVDQSGNTTTIQEGTNAVYARIHEEGGTISKTSRKGKSFTAFYRKRSFLSPSVKQNIPYLKENLSRIFTKVYGE